MNGSMKADTRRNISTLGLFAAAGLLLCVSGVMAQVIQKPSSGGPMGTPAGVAPTTVVPYHGPVIIMPPAPRRPRPSVIESVRLEAVTADVQISDQVATTHVTYTLHNVGNVASEAQLVIPVPDGVTIRSFQYDGTGPEPTAILLARDEARNIYHSIVNSMRDPGLLEFAGYGAIRSSVFPVPAGATQNVRVVYEQALPASGDRIDYVLPRSESNTTDQVKWGVKFTVNSKRPITSVFSPSHAMTSERKSPGQVTVNIDPAAFNQPGSVMLSYLVQPAGDGVAASIIAMPDPSIGNGKGGYFMLVIGLPPTSPDAPKMKREVTLVMDRSGSMRGEKIVQTKAAAQQIISGLNDGEMFNIIDFSDSIQSFAAGPVLKDASSAARAKDYIAAINADGGTAIHAALLESLKPKPAAGMLPMVLFLTDGLPTVGEKSEVKIRDDAAKANEFSRRLFTFGVGYDVNSPLLANLAKVSRGAPTFVMPNEDVEAKVSQVFRRLAGPMLAAPSLTAMDGSGIVSSQLLREVQPAQLSDVFEGEQIVIYGQYTQSGTIKLKLNGTQGERARTFEIDVSTADASARNGFVGRLWAQRKIGALIEEIRNSAAEKPNGNPATDPRTKELVDEIVSLSKKFGILTEYTAFLATEKGEKYDAASFRGVMTDAAPTAVRRMAVRDGAGGVNQEVNAAKNAPSATPMDEKKQAYMDRDMQMREVRNVQAVNDRAFVYRNNRWLDMRILEQESAVPEQTVEFGTPDWMAVAEELGKQNLQGVLSLDGEVYFVLNGKRVLMKMQ